MSSNIFAVHIFSARALHLLLLLVLEKMFLIKLSYFIINMFIYLTINIMLCRPEPHIELAIDLILIQLSCSVCIFCFVNEWLTLELATFNNHNILSQNPRSGRLLICLHFKIRQSSLTGNGFMLRSSHDWQTGILEWNTLIFEISTNSSKPSTIWKVMYLAWAKKRDYYLAP